MKSQHLRRITVVALLSGLAATAAQAHPGHDASGLMEGLAHPFGLDHLLAMIAVGIWSVTALPAHKAWQGPACFMLALTLGAAWGATGVALPYLEHMVSLSVLLFGAMLILARRPSLPIAGLAIIGTAAALHGLAHGAQAPATGFATYAIGFLLTTAVLHMAGVGLGLSIRHGLAQRAHLALGSAGAALGVVGIYLFGQLAI